MNIQETLFNLQDLKYRDFQSKLIPNIRKDSIIGVRAPMLKKLAKSFHASGNTDVFLSVLPHKYYDENVLHVFLINCIKDFDKCIAELERFLPFVDNWAVCDSIRPLCFKNNKKELLYYIEKWIASSHTYTVRFAILMLMVYYLDEDFDRRYLDTVSLVKSDEYYVNMMISWYFATGLAKQYESSVIFLEERILPLWVHNKTIQKALESCRISDNKKTYLRSLKRK